MTDSAAPRESRCAACPSQPTRKTLPQRKTWPHPYVSVGTGATVGDDWRIGCGFP
jgi:hypothetical protein